MQGEPASHLFEEPKDEPLFRRRPPSSTRAGVATQVSAFALMALGLAGLCDAALDTSVSIASFNQRSYFFFAAFFFAFLAFFAFFAFLAILPSKQCVTVDTIPIRSDQHRHAISTALIEKIRIPLRKSERLQGSCATLLARRRCRASHRVALPAKSCV
jgi:hypothetical protein